MMLPPRTPNRMNRTPAPTPVPIALMPSQSATFMSPGLPAIARRFSVRSLNELEVIRATAPDRRGGERLDRAVEERLLELQLLEVLGRHLAELREAGLERVLLARAGDAERDQDDGDGGGCGDDDGFHRLDLDVHDLADEEEAGAHRERAAMPSRITPSGMPRTSGGLTNIGSKNVGAARKMKKARKNGRAPTT